MPETSRECVVCLLDDSSFTVPVLVSCWVEGEREGGKVCKFCREGRKRQICAVYFCQRVLNKVLDRWWKDMKGTGCALNFCREQYFISVWRMCFGVERERGRGGKKDRCVLSMSAKK